MGSSRAAVGLGSRAPPVVATIPARTRRRLGSSDMVILPGPRQLAFLEHQSTRRCLEPEARASRYHCAIIRVGGGAISSGFFDATSTAHFKVAVDRRLQSL